MRGQPASLRRILLSALAALCIGLAIVTLLTGFSTSTPLRVVEAVAVFGAGLAILSGAVVFALLRLGNWRDPESEEEFEALVRRSERLAREGYDLDAEPDGEDLEDDAEEEDGGTAAEREFAQLVRAAVDELPLEFHRALEHVAIVISDDGWRHRAYGLYQGDTIARDHFHERILIFRDTLTRDFGHDRGLLARQVRRTVRHELAHHLGWDENGVRGLGL